MNDDEIRDILDEAGRAPVDPPDPDFADHLEQRLRAMHGLAGEAAPEPQARPRRWLAPALAGAAAALIIGIALLVPSDDDPGLQLTAARNAEVVLPDGEIVPGEAGLDLPDGSLIRTDPDGFATVDDVEIPGDAEAVVEGGTVRLIDDLASAPAASTTSTTTSVPGGGGSTTTSTAAPEDPTQPTSPTTATPSTPPPDPGVPPATDVKPTTTTTRPAPARLELRATRVPERRVELRWTAYRGPDFARYVLIRTITASSGEKTSRVVFQTEEQRRLSFVDRPPPDSPRVAYRVVALDGDGDVVAASPTVQPT